MKTAIFAAAATCVVASGAGAATTGQGTGYVLGDGGTTLSAVLSLATPVATGTVALNDSGVPVALDAIAYRPNTGGFFGYQDATDTVYSVDVATGAVSAVISGGPKPDMPTVETTTPVLGFDFNNVLDAARVVSANDENLVFFPTPTRDPADLVRATDLFYVAGDANEGADPNVFANAYTNAVALPVSATQQYVLDSNLDILATLGNNEGTLATVGQILVDGTALDFSDVGGLDILSLREGDNLAVALLTVGGLSNLYSFGLPTDAGDVTATLLGSLGTGYSGLAVAPAAVPLPAAGLLLVAGLGGLTLLRARRA